MSHKLGTCPASTMQVITATRTRVVYTGTVPIDHSSCTGRRRGSVIKAADADFWRVVVELAWKAFGPWPHPGHYSEA